MKGLFIFVVIVVSWIVTDFAREYNSRLGEILSMIAIHPFVLLFVAIIARLLYVQVSRFFSEKETETRAESTAKINHQIEDCSGSDFYLKKISSTGDCIEYQVTTKENIELWNGRCNLKCGKPHSIILYSGKSPQENDIQVAADEPGVKYSVREGQTIIGSIVVAGKGFRFIDTDNVQRGAAVLKTRINIGLGNFADWLITWDTLIGFSSKSKFQYYLLKDGSGKSVGKYFMPTGNIDLTRDSNNKLDRRIAAAFAVLIDCGVMGSLERCDSLREESKQFDFIDRVSFIDGVHLTGGAALLIGVAFVLYFVVSYVVPYIVGWVLW